MKAGENILAGLARLLKEGGLPKSACAGALLRAIRPLLDSGVVAAERAGSGSRLAVRDSAALLEFVRRHFPDLPAGPNPMSRVAGVARFRDSKTFRSDTPEIVCVRAWQEEALLKDGQTVGAARASLEHGMFSFLLSEHYSLRGVCALVENPALFAQFERLAVPAGLAILSACGCVSGRLLDWLAAADAPDFSLIHLPDYDPVGMVEFTRLRVRLGARVRLHLPENLPNLFNRFSNPAILEKSNNRSMLAKLRRSNLPEVRQVVTLIDRHNACLEQESLIIAQ